MLGDPSAYGPQDQRWNKREMLAAKMDKFLAVSVKIFAVKGAIRSNIKPAIKLKTSPARLAQLLQPSLAFCFSLQPMTAYRPGLEGTPSLAAS